jgi:prolyl-tRNA synthetase
LEALVCKHIEAVGAQRVTFPALTAASLWEKTGRLAEIGPELIKLKDRHKNEYLLAPVSK